MTAEIFGIEPGDTVKVGNGGELFRVSEFVERRVIGGSVANLWSVTTGKARNGVSPADLLLVSKGPALEDAA